MAKFVDSVFTGADGTQLWGGFTGSLGETYAKVGPLSFASPVISGNGMVDVTANYTAQASYTSNKTSASASYSSQVDLQILGDYTGAGPGLGCSAAAGGFFLHLLTGASSTTADIRLEQMVGDGSTYVPANIGGSFTVSPTDTYRVKLSSTGSALVGRLQRLSDNYYLNNAGVWQAAVVDCLSYAASLGTNTAPAVYFRGGGGGKTKVLNFSADDGAAAGPTINTQPSNQSVGVGASATFTVAATTSGGALTYQWQRSTNGGTSWANVATGTGGTTASYTTPAATVSGGNANNGDRYRCVVTDSNGSTNSSSATLTVSAAAATITSQPLVRNNGGTQAANGTLSSVMIFNQALTAQVGTTKTNVSINSSRIFSVSDSAMVAGTTYKIAWRETTGEYGIAEGVAV